MVAAWVQRQGAAAATRWPLALVFWSVQNLPKHVCMLHSGQLLPMAVGLCAHVVAIITMGPMHAC